MHVMRPWGRDSGCSKNCILFLSWILFLRFRSLYTVILFISTWYPDTRVFTRYFQLWPELRSGVQNGRDLVQAVFVTVTKKIILFSSGLALYTAAAFVVR